ncbi:SLAP domain-containing protein, partial [uncultured Lactobacillus sp.]
MKVKTKIAALLVAGLFSTAIIFTITSQAAPTVQAANHTLTKTIMHKSVAYTEAGKRTKNKYRAFTTVKVEDEPVIIKKQPYYKLKGKNRYL